MSAQEIYAISIRSNQGGSDGHSHSRSAYARYGVTLIGFFCSCFRIFFAGSLLAYMSDSSPSCSSTSLSSSRKGQARRQALFDFSAPPLERKRPQCVPIPAAPFHFLDSHISESLSLSHVKILPSLPVDVFACLDLFSEELEAFDSTQFTIHSFNPNDLADSANALSIAHIRKGVIRFASTQITDSLVLHPSQPDLDCSLLQWIGARSELRHTLVNKEYALQNLVLLVKPLAHYAELNGKNQELLGRMQKHTEQLISTMVFCTDALPVMEDMSRLDGMDHFPWRLDSLCPAASRPRSPPPDASAVPWIFSSSRRPSSES